MRTYARNNCPVCDRMITLNGLGRTNHYRAHVREGKMVERVVTLAKYPYQEHHFDTVEVRETVFGRSAGGRTMALVRTKLEIAAEIAALEALRSTVRSRSHFGASHRSQIEADIEVLQHRKEPSLDAPEDFEEFERTCEIAGQSAWDWLVRLKSERPSDDWKAMLPEPLTDETQTTETHREMA